MCSLEGPCAKGDRTGSWFIGLSGFSVLGIVCMDQVYVT